MTDAPAIVQIIAGVLIILTGIIALIAAFGQIRFTSFKTRIHTLSLINSLGLLTLLAGCCLISIFDDRRGFLHEFLIVVFIFLTSPIATMLLIRSYIMRIERMRS